MKKHQGSVGAGIAFLIFAPVTLLMGFMIFSMTSRMGFPGFSIIPLVVTSLMTIFFIVIGVLNIIWGKRSNIVKAQGKTSKCCVIDKRFHLRHNHMNSYLITVEFVGESGNKYQQTINIGLSDYHRLEIGTFIECKVLGDECFIDRFHITIVENNY